MTTIAKILLAIGVLAGACYACIYFTEASASKQVQIAKTAAAVATAKAEEAEKTMKEKDGQVKDLQDQVSEWHNKALAAMAEVAAKEKDLQATQAKLAAMGSQKPVTNPTTIPAEQKPLAASYTVAGYPPTLLQDGGLGFNLEQARPMLGLIQDGLAYPSALTRISLMENEVSTLSEQKQGLQTVVEDKTQEAATQAQATKTAQEAEDACKTALEDTQSANSAQATVIAGEEKMIKAERHKKYFWGGAGIAIGWGLKVLVLAL
jgi:sensor c-di-GMP phosphodiesterase-like protein